MFLVILFARKLMCPDFWTILKLCVHFSPLGTYKMSKEKLMKMYFWLSRNFSQKGTQHIFSRCGHLNQRLLFLSKRRFQRTHHNLLPFRRNRSRAWNKASHPRQKGLQYPNRSNSILCCLQWMRTFHWTHSQSKKTCAQNFAQIDARILVMWLWKSRRIFVA